MGDQSLDLWSLVVSLAILVDWPPDNQLGGVGTSVSAVELTKFVGSLGGGPLEVPYARFGHLWEALELSLGSVVLQFGFSWREKAVPAKQ